MIRFPMSKEHLWHVLAVILVFVAGYAFADRGPLACSAGSPAKQSLFVNGRDMRQGLLINPLLDCNPNEVDFRELKPFKDKVIAFIAKNSTTDDQVSVYFRDLNNGPWFQVNAEAVFAPGSLLKVPLAMSYYSVASQSAGILNSELVWKPDPRNPLGKPVHLTPGRTYTVRELIRRMLQESDNAATKLLYEHLKAGAFARPYTDLGLSVPDPTDSAYEVSAPNYNKFFRVLFNASYLNRDASREILALLSGTDFTAGLRAGVPSSVIVSHKYGERLLAKNVELHDCGIVYYPRHPYTLCVMTNGRDLNSLANIIRGISRIAYEEIDSQLGQ